MMPTSTTIDCSTQPCIYTVNYPVNMQLHDVVGDLLQLAFIAVLLALIPLILAAAWAVVYHHKSLRLWYMKDDSPKATEEE
jgi:hypothetical protein